jgi:hypothetical protein
MTAIYLLFFFSGVIKAFLNYYHINIPVDLTLLSGIILILFAFTDFLLHGIKVKFSRASIITSSILLIFFIWMIFSLLYTESPDYSYKKSILFLTNIIAFFYPLVIQRFDVKKFVKYLIVFIPIILLWFFYIYLYLSAKNDISESFLEFSGLYLSLSTIAGILAVVFLTSKEKIFASNIFNIIAGFFLIALILLTGARGPLFFAVLTIFLYFVYRVLFLKYSLIINLKKFVISSLLIIPVVLFSGIYVINKYYDNIEVLLQRSLFRINLLISGVSETGEMGKSVDTRMELYKYSLNEIFSNFSTFLGGNGIGSFGILHSGIDGREYPHNILL